MLIESMTLLAFSALTNVVTRHLRILSYVPAPNPEKSAAEDDRNGAAEPRRG